VVPPLRLVGLACRIIVICDGDQRHHILFTKDGRSLQLDITGPIDLTALRLATSAITPISQRRLRLRSLERLADLAEHRALRSSLYPPEPRSSRLVKVLLALDGWLSGSTQRDIAIALFGEGRVERDWVDPADHLRDQTRRAINRGRALMRGGYFQLLK
jgi:hypothetical protein